MLMLGSKVLCSGLCYGHIYELEATYANKDIDLKGVSKERTSRISRTNQGLKNMALVSPPQMRVILPGNTEKGSFSAILATHIDADTRISLWRSQRSSCSATTH